MAAISKQNQKNISLKVTEDLGLYERFEEIIKLVNLYNDTYRKSNVQEKVNQRTIAQQVREQRDKAILKSVLLFGKIN